MFLQGTLDIYFVGLKDVKNSQFWCHIIWKKNECQKNGVFSDIKHGLTMTSYILKLNYSFYTIPIYGLH